MPAAPGSKGAIREANIGQMEPYRGRERVRQHALVRSLAASRFGRSGYGGAVTWVVRLKFHGPGSTVAAFLGQGNGPRLRPMPCAATVSADTRRDLSRRGLGTTIPRAATTSAPRRTGTATEQAPSVISSAVVA